MNHIDWLWHAAMASIVLQTGDDDIYTLNPVHDYLAEEVA